MLPSCVSSTLFRQVERCISTDLVVTESLGQSSRAALETVFAQTTVLLEDLRQDGGVGSFVTLENYVMDQIPKSQPF